MFRHKANIHANRRSPKDRRCCTRSWLGFLSLLFLCGSVILFMSFQEIYEYIIKKNIVLSPEKEIYAAWKNLPYTIHFNVFMFNITNQEDFPWKSTKPVVQELGPYVFREIFRREDVRFLENGTLAFRNVKKYFFQPDLSNGSLDDVIHTVNVPALTAGFIFKTTTNLGKSTLPSALRFLGVSIITKRTVRELTFEGYHDTITKIGPKLFKSFPSKKFGYFFEKNGTYIEDFNIDTGVKDNDRYNAINSWNGKPSLPFDFKDMVEYYRIPVNRYALSKHFMDNGTVLPENKCFCSGLCLKSGVYNASFCQFGMPLFVSFPHFYNADPSYVEALHGLSPNETIHETQILVEPVIGAAVEVKGRFQLNAYLTRVPGFELFESVPDILIPVLWFEEHAVIDKNLANRLFAVTRTPYIIAGIAKYTLLIFGVVLGIVTVASISWWSRFTNINKESIQSPKACDSVLGLLVK